MKLTPIPDLESTRQMTADFRGYNHNLRIYDNEFYDMENMTSDVYPLLAPRRKRGVYGYGTNLSAVVYTGNVVYEIKDVITEVDDETIINTYLFKNGVQTALEGLRSESYGYPHEITMMNAIMIIMPEKLWYNTVTDEWGSLEEHYELPPEDTYVSAKLCTLDGVEYTYEASPTVPVSPVNGEYWCDTSGDIHVLKVYSSATGTWTSVPTTYVEIWANGIGEHFNKNDVVSISGFGIPTLDTDHLIYDVSENTIIVSAIIDQNYEEALAEIDVKRTMPDEIQFLVEHNNRLWGCNKANEIYASALGDPKNWKRYSGTAADSYAVSVGTTEPFTGAAVWQDGVVFFKENMMYRIYGTKPSNFQTTGTPCIGVASGCHRSLVTINGILYFVARNDICALSSSLPVSIAKALNLQMNGRFSNNRFENACCGRFFNKLYFSAHDTVMNKNVTFVYDTARGIWHKENANNAICYENTTDNLMYIAKHQGTIDTNDKLEFVVSSPSDDTYEEEDYEDDVDSFVETGVIGLDLPDSKYISKIQLRIWVAQGAQIKLFIQYDNLYANEKTYYEQDTMPFSQFEDEKEREWEELLTICEPMGRTYTLPIIPKRCDTARLRIEGKGNWRIYSICKTIEKGSDV